jgi:hypothetical protein
MSIKLDPFRETADIDEKNNNWPANETPSRFQMFKQKNERQNNRRNQTGSKNPMQREIKEP